MLTKSSLYKMAIIAFMAITTIFFTNCSGGSKTSSSGGNDSGSAQNVTDLEGIWILNLCVNTSSGPQRDSFLVSVTSSESIHFSTQIRSYSAQPCSGLGSPTGTIYNMGPIQFTQTLRYNGRTFFRGTWTDTNSGHQHKVFWALKSADLLCPGIDSPYLVTAEQMNAVVETIQNHTCYTRH